MKKKKVFKRWQINLTSRRRRGKAGGSIGPATLLQVSRVLRLPSKSVDRSRSQQFAEAPECFCNELVTTLHEEGSVFPI